MLNIDEKYESEYYEFLKSFILQNTPEKLGPFNRKNSSTNISVMHSDVSVCYESHDFSGYQTYVTISVKEKRFIQVSKYENIKNTFVVNDRFADLHQITNTYNDLIKQLTHNMLG
jgi:hypothetical protein